MANVIGEALIAIRPETTGFASQTKTGVLGAAKSIAGALAVTFAATKVFDFGKAAVLQAADVQKANEAVRFEYGKSAKAIFDFAHSSAADLGISTQTAVTTASSFGILFKNVGIGQKTAADMTVGFEKLAGSLSLIKNASPAESMSALTTAIAGNTRGLRQLGIVVTPATEQLYAASHGIIQTSSAVKDAQTKLALASGKYRDAVQKYTKSSSQATSAQLALGKAHDAVTKAIQGQGVKLTPAQKAMAIYGIATQKLGQYMNEAHKSSGNFSDQLEILRAHLSNAELLIGQKVLPIVANLFKEINGPLISALKRWTNIVADEVNPWLVKLDGFVKAHQGTIKELAGDVLKVVAVLGLWVGSITVLAAAFAALTSPITIIVALGVAAVYAYDHWKPFHDIVHAVISFVAGHIGLWKEVARDLLAVGVALTPLIAAWLAYQAAMRVTLAAQIALNVAMDANPIGLVVVAVAALAVGVVELYERWKPFRDIVNSTARYLRANFIPDVIAVKNEIAKLAGDVGIRMANIKGAIHDMVFVAKDLWSRFGAAVKDTLTIAKLEINVFLDIVQGHWSNALHDMAQIASNEFHLIINVINAFTGGAASKIGAAASGMFHALVRGISGMPGAVRGVLNSVVGALLSFTFSAASLLYNAGVAIMNGLLAGLEAAFNSVKNFISGVTGWISSHKGPLDYDRQLLVPHGLAIMAGLHEGLTTGFGPVKALVGGMAPQLAGSVGGGATAGGGATVGGGNVFHFDAGSIVIHDARDPGLTARAVLDEAVRRARG